MPNLLIETRIRAPIDICFDLARDVDAHAESAAFSSERVVEPGRTHGLLEVGDRPQRFVDEMIQGAFKRLRHVHEFEFKNGITTMRDTLEWEPPFGFIGRLADFLFLRRHMRWFVSTKQSALKTIAESRANSP